MRTFFYGLVSVVAAAGAVTFFAGALALAHRGEFALAAVCIVGGLKLARA